MNGVVCVCWMKPLYNCLMTSKTCSLVNACFCAKTLTWLNGRIYSVPSFWFMCMISNDIDFVYYSTVKITKHFQALFYGSLDFETCQHGSERRCTPEKKSFVIITMPGMVVRRKGIRLVGISRFRPEQIRDHNKNKCCGEFKGTKVDLLLWSFSLTFSHLRFAPTFSADKRSTSPVVSSGLLQVVCYC